LEDAEIISDEEEEAAAAGGGEGTSIQNGDGKEERKKLSVKAWAVKKEPGIQQDEEKPETEAGESTNLEVSLYRLYLFLQAKCSLLIIIGNYHSPVISILIKLSPFRQRYISRFSPLAHRSIEDSESYPTSRQSGGTV
jgi:hypothetical protein